MIPLVYYPDERLNTKAEAVTDIGNELIALTRAMVETMHDAKGIGLAGPQVGRMYRIFVVHLPDDEPRVFINPRLTAVSPDQGAYEEGCLSVPGIYADITRPLAVSVEAWDDRGRWFQLDAEGILARVIQHENDHLDGILFFEHLTNRRQERLLRNYAIPEES